MKSRHILPGFLLLFFLLFSILGISVFWLRENVKLAWNETESLPQSLFWVRMDQKPERGDYVLFEPPGAVGSPYPFIKRVAGVAGDIIEVQGQLIIVAGVIIGKAKTVFRQGESLHTIASGVIPPGFYFVHTDHEDSYDSRYQSIGLVSDTHIIGRATPLF